MFSPRLGTQRGDELTVMFKFRPEVDAQDLESLYLHLHSLFLFFFKLGPAFCFQLHGEYLHNEYLRLFQGVCNYM